MIITICILILAYTLLGKPVDKLLGKLKDVDWKSLCERLFNPIKKYCSKAGRVAARPVLRYYYVLRDGDVSTMERALLVGAIVYIVIPGDLIPRSVFRWLGILDDFGAAYYVYNKIKNKLTPEIESKVQNTLDTWFGPEEATVIE